MPVIGGINSVVNQILLRTVQWMDIVIDYI